MGTTATTISVGLMQIIVTGDPIVDLAQSGTGTLITFNPTATGAVNTVTVAPISPFTLNPAQLPLVQPQDSGVIMPSSLVPIDGAITFSCTNNLTSGDSPVTAAFTATLGADPITEFLIKLLPIALSISHDPTMVFNPPE